MLMKSNALLLKDIWQRLVGADFLDAQGDGGLPILDLIMSSAA